MRKIEEHTPAVAAGADGQLTVGEAPHSSKVTSVSYVPEAAIAGVDTNTRKVALVNRGQNGSGNTEIAALTFSSGVNGVENDEKQLVLSATQANRKVKKGDVLEFVSTHLGTGIADPGGLVQVEIR